MESLGSEFHILLDAPLGAIARKDAEIARAIGRMRGAEVGLSPGYDGEFGVVRVCGD